MMVLAHRRSIARSAAAAAALSILGGGVGGGGRFSTTAVEAFSSRARVRHSNALQSWTSSPLSSSFGRIRGGSSRSSSASALAASSSSISISDAYDGGNGEFVSAEKKDGEMVVNVRIRPDPFTELEGTNHFQYFSFRATPTTVVDDPTTPLTVRYVLENAGDASYAPAWDGSTVFYAASADPSDETEWKRKVDTTYDKETGRLEWTHVHDDDGAAYFAYFPPYSYGRHLGLVQRCAESRDGKVRSLGQTIDGREIDCVTVGNGPRVCWIIHRQHPGESMAEFYAEGLLERLLGLNGDEDDDVVRRAKELYTFNIVPSMNPDGALRGYLRTNAAGSNLNREWCPSSYRPASSEEDVAYDAPTLERSPEVKAVLDRMDETGCDAFLDIHGDELLPFNFLAGSEGVANWNDRLSRLHGSFLASYVRSNSDMQAEVSYEPEAPGEGRTNVCSNQIAIRYDCLAATLEMPFKDCLTNSDPEKGWSPERAKELGASVLEALCHVQPYLREEGEFWTDFPEEDAYIPPSDKY